LIALPWLTQPGHATTVRPMNIVDLIDNSETIVAGRVEKVTDGFNANGMPYTEITVHVLDRFRGAEGSTYTFRQFGLTGPRTMPDGKVFLGGRPEGWPAWHVGDVSLLFLYAKGRVTGFQTTVGWLRQARHGQWRRGECLRQRRAVLECRHGPQQAERRRTEDVRREEWSGERGHTTQLRAARGRSEAEAGERAQALTDRCSRC
jgi:hypothetical protein